YGSGFPKSHDVARGVDKAVGIPKGWINCDAGPFSDEGKAWAGWGTALKPAFEPIVLARKPITAGSIAKQHLATGTGGLNIEAARIGGGEKRIIDGSGDRAESQSIGAFKGSKPRETTEGRWPANVVHDGSVEVVSRFPAEREGLSAARFFYSAKAGAKDRAGSEHPTVKPLALMQWLVRLTTPRGGRILDPFGGSGSTAWAAAVEGCACDLIERDPEYAAHIRGRMADFDPAKISQPTETPADETQGDLFNGGAL
ncbi:MAG: DNA methyltransferase, partial [Pseudomonadota bacterium]